MIKGEDGLVIEFDKRDLLEERRMRKIERRMDGRLVVVDGVWFENRFVWRRERGIIVVWIINKY